jgi:hypothetical protein
MRHQKTPKTQNPKTPKPQNPVSITLHNYKFII